MKLGLVIEITSQGAGNAVKTYNTTPILERYASASRSFIKDVFPVREDLKLSGLDPLTSLDESGRSVVFVRFFGPDGYLICIFLARPENSGRPFDGTAAWIHVPASVILRGHDAMNLIDEVESALSEEKGTNYNKLEALFAKDYGEKDVTSAISAIQSQGTSYGVRYYGNGTVFVLNELLGDALAQKEYGKYRAVFFLRKNAGIAVDNISEITAPLTQTCIISAPPTSEGYTPYVNGMPFRDKLEWTVDTPLTIVWKKNGYKDITINHIIKEDDAKNIAKLFAINKTDVEVAIKKDSFVIEDEYGSKISKFQISINGKKLVNSIYVSENSLVREKDIKVEADGYKTYIGKHIFDIKSPIIIQLQKETFSYEFSIPLVVKGKTIEYGRFSVELGQKLKECPIKGYYSEDTITTGKEIKLIHKNYTLFKIKYIGVGIISCILALVIYLGCQTLNYSFGTQTVEKVNQNNGNSYGESDGDTSVDTIECVKSDSMCAIKYLENNIIWHKDSLENYELTRGLFDELNEFKRDDIIKRGEILGNVEKFNNIINAFIEHDFDHHIGKEDNKGNYNSNSDKGINIGKYIDWISIDHSQKANPMPSNQSSKNKRSKITGRNLNDNSDKAPANSSQGASKGSKRNQVN